MIVPCSFIQEEDVPVSRYEHKAGEPVKTPKHDAQGSYCENSTICVSYYDIYQATAFWLCMADTQDGNPPRNMIKYTRYIQSSGSGCRKLKSGKRHTGAPSRYFQSRWLRPRSCVTSMAISIPYKHTHNSEVFIGELSVRSAV